MNKPVLLVAAGAIATAMQASAHAQGIDHTARRDVRLGVAAPLAPTAVEIAAMAEDLPFTFAAQIGSSYVTNATYSGVDAVEALYGAPDLSLSYSRRRASDWTFAALLEAGGFFYDEGDGAFDEVDAIGGLSLAHPALGGRFTLHHDATIGFDRELSGRLYTALDYGLRFDRSFSLATVSLDVLYSASDDPAQRRYVFVAAAQRTFSAIGADWTLAQSFAVSDFRESAAADRTDVRAKTIFGPTWAIGQGLSAGFQLLYVHNFSNRPQSRWDAFEIGPTVRFARPFGR